MISHILTHFPSHPVHISVTRNNTLGYTTGAMPSHSLCIRDQARDVTRLGCCCCCWECAELGLEADEKMMLGLGTVAWWTKTRVIIYAAHVVIYCNIRGWRWTWIQSTWENDAMAWKNINSFPSYTNFVC